MSLGELLEKYIDYRKFRHILSSLQNRGLRSYEQTNRTLSEAYDLLEKLKGKIPEKKMQMMKKMMSSLEEDFEYDWLSGVFR